jgi:hypothetical protein
LVVKGWGALLLHLSHQQNYISMSNSNDYETITPGVGKALSSGWETMKVNFLYFFLIIILLSMLDSMMELFGRGLTGEGNFFKTLFSQGFNGELTLGIVFAEFIAVAHFLLIMPVFEYGADLIFVHGVRRQKLDFKDFINGVNNYLTIVLNHLLIVGLVGMAMVALIIPGIIVACRLVFSSYLVMDKGLDPISAVETSWKLTRGHGWKIFRLGFLSIFIFILGFICFFVGVIPAVMWIKASFASLYQSVLNEKGEDFFPTSEEAV